MGRDSNWRGRAPPGLSSPGSARVPAWNWRAEPQIGRSATATACPPLPGGELRPPRRAWKLPGIGASALARGRLGRHGHWAPPPGFVCGCWLRGLMAGLFVKPAPRLRSYGGDEDGDKRSLSPSRSFLQEGARGKGRLSLYWALFQKE
jgi:hypothetical protein